MPSSVSGKPVESSGSMTPAADGSSAHARRPPRGTRNATRGAWTNGSVGARDRGTARATDGSASSSRSQAGAPSDARSVAASGSVSAAPALVMPLLNRSTQIQPPGNT